MSKKDMLGSSALAHAAGPLKTLIDRLDGPNGDTELEALNRFLRKENPWPEVAPRSHRHLINCDAGISDLADGLTLAGPEHQLPGRVTGKFAWLANKVGLYLDPAQVSEAMLGCEIMKKLADQPVLPFQVLDYLLERPKLIPEAWKDEGYIFFWGSIFVDSEEELYVYCLNWTEEQWEDIPIGLKESLGFGSDQPAAVMIGR